MYVHEDDNVRATLRAGGRAHLSTADLLFQNAALHILLSGSGAAILNSHGLFSSLNGQTAGRGLRRLSKWARRRHTQRGRSPAWWVQIFFLLFLSSLWDQTYG